MKGVYPLTEKEKAHMQILNGMMEQISSIIEDIYTAIPMMDRSFSDDSILVKLIINCIKTLGLDKEKEVPRLSFEIEHKMVVIIKASFAFIDCFIIGSDSNFSSRVLGANFCCATEIKEITVGYNLAFDAAKLDGAHEMIIIKGCGSYFNSE